jgi:K+-transporting ATPase A subunit
MNLPYTIKNFYEKAVHGMLAVLIVLALVYCAILLSLVFSVIEKKQNTLASRDLSSELSTLEMTYGNIVSSISEKDLDSNGFTRVDGATFAVRKDDIASYTVLYAR